MTTYVNQSRLSNLALQFVKDTTADFTAVAGTDGLIARGLEEQYIVELMIKIEAIYERKYGDNEAKDTKNKIL